MELLSQRALNRATLARQRLLHRGGDTALGMVEHLVGLNAQDPDPPYVGLWSRIAGFEIDDLTGRLFDRSVVRGSLFRGTQHMVSAGGYVWLRPLPQPVLERLQRSAFGRPTRDIDLAELVEAARTVIGQGEVTRPALGRALAERWPGHDPEALARSRSSCCRSSTRLRTAPGAGGARPRSSSPRAGWAARSTAPTPPASSSCATWPGSVPPRSATSPPGAA